MTNCVPQVFKWFVTHLFRGILASLIDETQGLFFLSKSPRDRRPAAPAGQSRKKKKGEENNNHNNRRRSSRERGSEGRPWRRRRQKPVAAERGMLCFFRVPMFYPPSVCLTARSQNKKSCFFALCTHSPRCCCPQTKKRLVPYRDFCDAYGRRI